MRVHVSPRSGTRVLATAARPGTPRVKPGPQAGATVKVTFRTGAPGGGLGEMQPSQARREGGGPRATPNPRAHSARFSLPPCCPLTPAPLTRRARPPLATGLRAGLPGAVRRGGRRQLVRFDDHGGGSGRPPWLSAPPAAPLTQVPCAPLQLREGRSHRPTWCALRPLTPPPLPCPALAPGPAHEGPRGTKYATPRSLCTNAVTFSNALKGTYPGSGERTASGPLEGRGYGEKSLRFAARRAGTLTLGGDLSGLLLLTVPSPNGFLLQTCQMTTRCLICGVNMTLSALLTEFAVPEMVERGCVWLLEEGVEGSLGHGHKRQGWRVANRDEVPEMGPQNFVLSHNGLPSASGLDIRHQMSPHIRAGTLSPFLSGGS